jgi:hypothetical protein
MKTNLFILSVVFAAVPEVATAGTAAEDLDTAAELFTFSPAEDLTALSLAGYEIKSFNISKVRNNDK